MPEISEAVTQVFGLTQSTDVVDTKMSITAFITDGLLTHFFFYHDKPNEDNITWLLEHINGKKSWLRDLQLPRDGVALLSSKNSSSHSEEVPSTLLSNPTDPHCLSLNALKFYLLKILGSCTSKQQFLPYEPEVISVPSFSCTALCTVGTLLLLYI